jgi:midasin (ATPase involved in ribosome maturation)
VPPGLNIQFSEGTFTKAVKEGFWLLLDEANLA